LAQPIGIKVASIKLGDDRDKITVWSSRKSNVIACSTNVLAPNNDIRAIPSSITAVSIERGWLLVAFHVRESHRRQRSDKSNLT
jgi:hypothetical protein